MDVDGWEIRVSVDRLPAELALDPSHEYVRRLKTRALRVALAVGVLMELSIWWGYFSGRLAGAGLGSMSGMTAGLIVVVVGIYWLLTQYLRGEMVVILGDQMLVSSMGSVQTLDLSSPGELVVSEGRNGTWVIHSSAFSRHKVTVSKEAYPDLPDELRVKTGEG